MDRRDFLKTTSTVIAGSTLAPGLLAGNSAPAASNAGGRLLFPINRNWRYNKTFVEGAHGREFDDSAFERVVIPHTNVRLPWHSFDDKTYEFVSIYRRRFKLPAEARGKHVFVDFEGVMTASTVWINGVQPRRIQRRLHAVFFRPDAAHRFRAEKMSWPSMSIRPSGLTSRPLAIRSTT